MERPRRLDCGSGENIGLRFGNRDEHGGFNTFHDGLLQRTSFECLSDDRRWGGRCRLSGFRFLLDGMGFGCLSRSRPGFPLDPCGGLGRGRFGARFRFLHALLLFGLAFEGVEVAQ